MTVRRISSILRIFAALVIAGTPLLFPKIASADPQITSYYIPFGVSGTNHPVSIAPGPDGNLWFVDFVNGQAGAISPQGKFLQHYTVGNSTDITAGGDGNLWIAHNDSDITRLTTSGTIANFSLGEGHYASEITTSSDGTVWFNDDYHDNSHYDHSRLGKITSNGVITEYEIPTAIEYGPNRPRSLVPDSSGNIWSYVNYNNYDNHTSHPILVKTTPSGQMNYIDLPSNINASLFTIDNANSLWSIDTRGTDNHISYIDKISEAGDILESYQVASNIYPTSITQGTDGSLWMSANDLNVSRGAILRMTEKGSFTEYISADSSGARSITVGPDKQMWFIEDPNRIGVLSPIMPAVPIDLYANSPARQAQLTWRSVAGATVYSVYRDGAKIASTSSTDYTDTSASDGTHSYYVTAVNDGGESEPSNTVQVVVDTTAPTITATTSPPANADGWNNQPVTVTFDCSDSGGSGIATCTEPQTVSSDGETTVTGTAVDKAGNTATTSVNIKLDTVNPTITFTAASDGWINTDLGVPYTCTNDDGTTSDYTAPIVTNPDGTTTATGTCTDEAGNTTTQTIPVQVDSTAPQVDYSLSQPTNDLGWSTSPVTVTFQCDDPGTADAASGIASCSDPVTVTDEGTTTVTGKAVDRAGNVTEVHVTVRIDSVKPTLNYTLSPAAPNGANGWYTSDVTINFTCADTTSGVASCPQSKTITADGDQTITATATDVAGNRQTVTIPIKLDKTAPAVSDVALSNPAVVYGSNLPTAFTATATDTASGVTHGEYYVDTDPGQGNGTSMAYGSNQLSGTANLGSLSVGTHTLYVRAQDAAGNWSAPVGTAFTVSYPVPVAPSNLTAVTPTNQALKLSWSATFDPSTPPAVSYNIYRNNTLVGTSTTTNFTDNNLSTDGTYTYYVTAVNQYGVESTPSNLVVAVYDTTKPIVIYTLSPAANAAGWNNSDVTATFSCSDNLAGIQSCPAPYTFSSDGASQSTTVFASDKAGNIATVAASGINVDKTAPVTTNANMSLTLVLSLLPVNITADTTDNLSGVVAGEYYIDTDPGQGLGKPLAYSNGTLSTSASISGLSTGQHTLYIRSQDKAGNWSAVASKTFTYVL